MFQLYFDTQSVNVEFARPNGTIRFKMVTPIYFTLGLWRVAVQNIFCNHEGPGQMGATYLVSNFIQTTMLNGIEQKILFLVPTTVPNPSALDPKTNRSKTCLCTSPSVLSYYNVNVAEMTEFDLVFQKGDGSALNFSEKFECTILLRFEKK